jgi:uncharacterized protein (TIGR03000 family)
MRPPGGVPPGGYHPGGRPGYGYGYGNYGRYGYGYGGFALGIGLGLGLGYGGYYGNYGFYDSPYAVPYYVPNYAPVPGGPDNAPGVEMPPSSIYVLPIPQQASTLGTARFTINVPATAKLWVDDLPTSQTGAVREFVTPPALEPGKTYRYTIRAQWEENGQPVTRERTVEFQAGSSTIVNFVTGIST